MTVAVLLLAACSAAATPVAEPPDRPTTEVCEQATAIVVGIFRTLVTTTDGPLATFHVESAPKGPIAATTCSVLSTVTIPWRAGSAPVADARYVLLLAQTAEGFALISDDSVVEARFWQLKTDSLPRDHPQLARIRRFEEKFKKPLPEMTTLLVPDTRVVRELVDDAAVATLMVRADGSAEPFTPRRALFLDDFVELVAASCRRP